VRVGDEQIYRFAPEQQIAERKKAVESNRAWKKYISDLKAKRHGVDDLKS